MSVDGFPSGLASSGGYTCWGCWIGNVEPDGRVGKVVSGS